jgi:hypothetical protein
VWNIFEAKQFIIYAPHAPLIKVLCIIIDAWTAQPFPRFPFNQKPHFLTGTHRPKSQLCACMAHGYVTKCFMTDDTVNHGSSHFIEVLFQTLEEVAAVCRQRNKPVPKHAVLQVDNTVSQAKNGIVAMILAWLVTTGIFVTLDLMLLLVGHTHEDIDQFFSLCKQIARGLGWYETPTQLLDELRNKLHDRVEGRNERLVCKTLAAVRDYKSWSRSFHREAGFSPRPKP